MSHQSSRSSRDSFAEEITEPTTGVTNIVSGLAGKFSHSPPLGSPPFLYGWVSQEGVPILLSKTARQKEVRWQEGWLKTKNNCSKVDTIPLLRECQPKEFKSTPNCHFEPVINQHSYYQ